MAAPSQIAHYRISAKIGEGGMGAVYRATDTKLNRDVAVKVLPGIFASDPDRLARFTREAQVLASLNHPNIAAIYGVEDRALVMELVEGATLADRITQGPMPFDEALPLIRQLIDALDCAHQKGVIHRDLKPANIKITPDGKVKMLDFGLAKALSGQPVAPVTESANSPTLTLFAGTVAGVILGTAAYMAPEQARGKPVDKRADIWAFGVVVYEMLTGNRLFEGESVSDILAQTLTKAIDLSLVPVQAIPLLRRCLDRDPRTRLRDIGDAIDLLQEPGVQSTLPVRRPRIWIAAVLAGVSLAAVFAALWHHEAARRDPPLLLRMSLGDARLAPPISPDGSMLIWAAGDDLRLRRLDDLVPRHLAGTEGASWSFWSGDSSAIGFFQQEKLRILPLGTAEIRTVAAAPEPGGAAWRGSAAGGDIVFVSARKLMHLNLASGAVREVPVVLPAGFIPLNPTFLPQSADFVFTAGPPDGDTRTLYRASLQGGAPTRLMETPYAVQFAQHPHSGKWFMFYSTSQRPKLLAVAVDPATGQESGPPIQLLDAIGSNTNTRRITVELSANGRIALRRNFIATPVLRIRWHAPDGKVLASLGEKMACNEIALSPTESRVAAVSGYPMRSLTIFDARTGDARRLTNASENVGQGVAWSPDGGMLYYQIEQPDGTWGIVRQNAGGSARPESIGHSNFTLTLMDISRDGRYLIFGPNQASGLSFYRMRTDGAAGSTPQVWASFGPNFRPRGAQGRFTPDGRFVFMGGGQAEGRFLPWLPEQPAITVNAGTVAFTFSGPFFSPDGKRLCGVDRDRLAVSCHSVTAAAGGPPVLGPPVALFSPGMPQLSAYSNIGTIARDSRILLLSTDEPEEIQWQFLSDWTMLLPGAKK